ncbi:hypothetical protein [Sphingosinicella sp.]|uniref:hypothetical protein n=1 Tax=Sphingosinicella sp. TaxID=1917971 RepID=UPI004037BA9D
MKASGLIILSLGIAAPAAAQRATSIYSSLNLDRCQMLEHIEEGASARWRCAGPHGVPLFVNTGDDRYDVDAGVDNGVWESLDALNGPGPNVEWRLRGGRPMAIIYRLIPVPELGEPPALIVETIGRGGRLGCEIARVNAQRADANARARAEADLRAAHFRCGRDQRAEIGR